MTRSCRECSPRCRSLLIAALVAVRYFYPPVAAVRHRSDGTESRVPHGERVQSDENLHTADPLQGPDPGASKLRGKGSRRLSALGHAARPLLDSRRADDYVLPYNLAEQAAQDLRDRRADVRAGDIVLDCGANIGVYTRVALNRGAKLVVAIEPAPREYRIAAAESSRRRSPRDE